MHLLLDNLFNVSSIATTLNLLMLISRCLFPSSSSLATTTLFVEHFAQDVLVIKEGAFSRLCLSGRVPTILGAYLFTKCQVEAFELCRLLFGSCCWPSFINQVLRIVTIIAF